jgi:hypothetical protein
MATLPRKLRFSLCALVTACAAASACAGVLYKSVDREGRMVFSDTPIEGAVVTQRIETSDSAKRIVEEGRSAPQYLALVDGLDETVRRANEKLDLAEHALAEARRSITGEGEVLALHSSRPSRESRQQLEFYKKEVLDARKSLLRILQQRAMLATRPLA